MKIKVTDIILFDDSLTWYEKSVYHRDTPIELNLTLGETSCIFDPELFEVTQQSELVRESLFPQNKVRPLYFDDLNSKTLVIFRIRPNHLLIDTTFSEIDIAKEVTFDENRNLALYLFFNFKTSNLTIRPKIQADGDGLIEKFRENLTDNALRQMILDLLTYKSIPTDYLNSWLSRQADISIIQSGQIFKVNIKGTEYFLTESASLNDIIYILRHKGTVSTEELKSKPWREKKGRKTSFDVDSLLRNYNRLKAKLREEEQDRGLSGPMRLSNFLETYLTITSKMYEIEFNAPENIKWYFKLRDTFNKP